MGCLSDERPSDVLGALPRRRPHRRSDKRPAPAPDGALPAGTRIATGPAASQGLHDRESRPGDRQSESGPDDRDTGLVGPRTRPHGPQRPGRPGRPERLRQPAQPAGVPHTPRRPAAPREPSPSQPTGRDILGIAAQAAAELAEIGLSVSARALRNAVGRLPRP